MDSVIPILCYGRAPARPLGGEHVRTVRAPDGSLVAVFPSGVRRGEFVGILMGALLVAGVLTGATVHFWRHPVPLANYVAAAWPLALVLLFFLGMLTVAYDEASRQVEFEVDAEEIVRLSFGPFGVRRQRWDLESVRDVRVESHISGSHPRVVLVTTSGRRHDVLNPGAAGALREDAEHVARLLRKALALV